jgi:hypothetical protein
MADDGVEEAAMATQNGAAAEELRDGSGIQRGRHDDELQLRATLLQPAQ